MLKDVTTNFEPDLAGESSPAESYLSNLSLAQPTPPSKLRTKPIEGQKLKKNATTEERGGEDGYEASDEAEEEPGDLKEDRKMSVDVNGNIPLLSKKKEATEQRENPEDRCRLRKRNREPEEEPEDNRVARKQKLMRVLNVEDDDAMRMSM